MKSNVVTTWLHRQLARPRPTERGDVPGWVMITVMTIVVASALFTAFQDRVVDFLNQALDQMQL